MRLTSIKLAGFKSFVDPTTIELRADLTAVVGPNGCGKSNVIDAVRWVTGESSARQLRGEALEDVIFAGSKSRKPVGRASVELTFDNSDAGLGGAYAAYGEISVRREQSRQTGSRYFLNGVRVRRRDVVDVFLGTGLGGRNSYAIIQQGAVNRLIDARPEQVRDILEEAAGISKYRERRRETENRIRHTRENLARLHERIGDSQQRLETLQRQARAANQYKALKQEQRRLKSGQLVLRWATCRDQKVQADRARSDAEIRLAEAQNTYTASQRAKSEAEARRRHAADVVDAKQSAYYDAQANRQRIAQALEHARQMAERATRERDALQTRLTDVEHQHQRQIADRDRARERVDTLTTARVELDNESSQAQEALDAATARVRDAEAARDELTDRADTPVAALETERQREADAQRFEATLAERRNARRGALAELHVADMDTLDARANELDARADALDDITETRRQVVARLDDLRADVAERERERESRRARINDRRASITALRRMAEAATGAEDSALSDWLTARFGSAGERTAALVDIDPEWQAAAEHVLGHWLASRSMRECTTPAALDEPPQAMTLVNAGYNPDAIEPRGLTEHKTLADVMKAPVAIRAVARRYVLVDDCDNAFARADQLELGEYCLAPDGACVGPGSVQVPAAKTGESGGILDRERQLRDDEKTLAAELAADETAQSQLAAAHETREASAARLAELDRAIETEQRDLAAARAELDGERARAEQQATRRRELNDELADIESRLERVADERHQAGARIAELAERAEAFRIEREKRQSDLVEARARESEARNAVGKLEQRQRQLDADAARAGAEHDAALARIAEAEHARDQISRELATHTIDPSETAAADGPTPADRAAAEQTQAGAEHALRNARDALTEAESDLARCNQAAMEAETEVAGVREAVQSARVESETATARRDALAEQIVEIDPDAAPQTLADELPDDADAEVWQSELDTVTNKLDKLGSVNLAAVEEYDVEAESERYLQDQYQDMDQALATLTEAIDKIDHETQTRFKATFEDINARFGRLFTDLFGGGHAWLEKTEADWLATGVRVIARPPGKSRVTLAMLSGGEKALTAVALLFALFQMNPAPFCMLDEIDAPLDDTNVGRFCDLVRRMADTVQFVLITHNKVTMELPDQLHGVTMAESGVSRLVSVDIEAALAMAGPALR